MLTMNIQPKAANGDQKDTWLNSTSETINYGGGPNLLCGFTTGPAGDQLRRSLLQYTLPAPLTANNIASATLNINVSNAAPSAEPAELRRCTRPEWVELEATWDKFRTDVLPGDGDWTNPGADWAFLEAPVLFTLPTSTGAFAISGTGSAKLIDYCKGAISLYDRKLILIMKRTTESGNVAGIVFGSANSPGNEPWLSIGYRRVPGIEYDPVDEVLVAPNAITI